MTITESGHWRMGRPVGPPEGPRFNENLIDYTSLLESRVRRQNQKLEEIYRLSANAEQEAEALLVQVQEMGRQLDAFLLETDYIQVIPDEK